MPLTSREGAAWADPLFDRLASHASSAEIAAAAGAAWSAIAAALSPVIGQRGTAALYERSLGQAAIAHPWLAPHSLGGAPSLDAGALQAALAGQPPAEARAAAALHLRSFNELLVSLVGRSLTERLLGSVWSHDAATPPAQDSSP